jgi:hypothetical protein
MLAEPSLSWPLSFSTLCHLNLVLVIQPHPFLLVDLPLPSPSLGSPKLFSVHLKFIIVEPYWLQFLFHERMFKVLEEMEEETEAETEFILFMSYYLHLVMVEKLEQLIKED